MKTQRLPKDKIKALYDQPGIYRMLDKQDNLLYIGKSIHIKQRVASYFSPTINRGRKIQRMVKLIESIEVYYTDTELDALLLECQLIQEQKPPYNTVLTKSQKYTYLEIREGKNYQLKVTRKPTQSARLTVGPLPHRNLARYAYCYIEKECTIRGNVYLGTFEEEVLQKGDRLQALLKHKMEQQVDRWAYEDAQKTLEAIKGMRYLCFIYELTKKVLTEAYIGKLMIPETNHYKYYAIQKGCVQKTIIGDEKEEGAIIQELKRVFKESDNKSIILPQEIDQILIIEAFKHKGMCVINV